MLDNKDGDVVDGSWSTTLKVRSYPSQIHSNYRLQSSPALIRPHTNQQLPIKLIPQETFQLRHQKFSRPHPLSVDPSTYRINPTPSSSTRRRRRSRDVRNLSSEESIVIRAVQETLAPRSVSPCRRRPKQPSKSRNSRHREPKDSTTFRTYNDDDDDDDDDASWDKYRVFTKRETTDTTTTEASSSLHHNADDKAMKSPYPSVVWIPENEQYIDTMDSDHRRGRDQKKTNVRSRSKAAAAALRVKAVLDKENTKKRILHMHRSYQRQKNAFDDESFMQGDNQSIVAQAAWYPSSCHVPAIDIPLAYCQEFDMLLSSIRKPTPPRTRRQYNDPDDIPTASVTAAAAAVPVTKASSSSPSRSRQKEYNSHSTPPKEKVSWTSPSPTSVVSIVEAQGNFPSTHKRSVSSSSTELLQLQQELKQIKEWTHAYTTSTNSEHETANNNKCTSSSLRKKNQRVQFRHPMVTDVQYRPKTLTEEVPNLFFAEEELLQLEKDRANHIHEEQFEMIARRKSDGRTIVSVRYPTPPMKNKHDDASREG